VRALSRRPETDGAILALGAEPARGALDDVASLMQAAQGVRAVFHCAANTSAWSRDKALQMATNVDGTVNLLQAAESAGVECFVHTSSVSAFSHLVHGTINEDTPQLGGQSWVNYERSKFLAEQAVRQSELPRLIFNPSHVLGPGDTQNWARLLKMVHDNTLPGVPPGSGAFADVREIAKAQVHAWQSGIRNQRYLLGGAHASFLEFVQLAAQLTGQKPPRFASPALLLRAAGHGAELLARFTDRMPQITPAAAALTCHHLRVDSSKAIAQLGYQETPLATLMADTLAWMRQCGMITPK
jgi:dihydroflavonol-4-reductase